MHQQKLIIIYDFDGTLTPYPIPQYDAIKKCGYDDRKLFCLINQIIKEKNVDLYTAFIEAIAEILTKNNISLSMESICLGAEKVNYNRGVLEFFESLKNKKINHYILTSGFKEYVKRTEINQYITDVYGTEVSFNKNNIIVNYLMKDKNKVNAIKEIKDINNCSFDRIIYVGDGLTDRYAFEYVHQNGGKAVLICNNKDDKTYQVLNEMGIIDYCFEPDFSISSEIEQYIKKRLDLDNK